jgi:hypothetical protein
MQALKSTFFGAILIIASTILLFWNEGRAVTTARALAEGAGIVTEVDAAKPDPAFEGKLIHVSGPLVPEGTLTDPQFGVKAEGAVRLRRIVEMYQWKEVSRQEERTNSDGSKTTTTVFDYQKAWSEQPIDSATFKTTAAPRNPPMPVKGESFDIGRAGVGGFDIAGKGLGGLASAMPLPVAPSDMKGFASFFSGQPLWLDANLITIGADKDVPAIGDLRLRFEQVKLDTVSVIGTQQGRHIESYTTSNGREIYMVQAGSATAAAMFKDAIEGNVFLTWMLRAIGAVLMFIGFLMSFSLLTATLGNIPVLGGAVRGGAALLSAGLTALLGALVVGIGWIFYRPLIGLAVIAVGLAIAFALGHLGKRQATPAAAQRG